MVINTVAANSSGSPEINTPILSNHLHPNLQLTHETIPKNLLLNVQERGNRTQVSQVNQGRLELSMVLLQQLVSMLFTTRVVANHIEQEAQVNRWSRVHRALEIDLKDKIKIVINGSTVAYGDTYDSDVLKRGGLVLPIEAEKEVANVKVTVIEHVESLVLVLCLVQL